MTTLPALDSPRLTDLTVRHVGAAVHAERLVMTVIADDDDISREEEVAFFLNHHIDCLVAIIMTAPAIVDQTVDEVREIALARLNKALADAPKEPARG